MKRIQKMLSVLLSAAIVLSSLFAMSAAAVTLKGDIDGDGKVTVSDVVTLRKIIMSGTITDEQKAVCDLDDDDKVSVSDVVILRQIIMNGTVTPPDPQPELFEKTVTDGMLYMLMNKTSGKVLNVRNSKMDENSRINQWTYTSSASQQWLAKATDSEGYYALLSGSSGYALTVGGDYSDGTRVNQTAYTGADNQLFKFTYDDNGYFTIVPKGNENYAIDVSGGSADDGAGVQIYTSNLSSAQKWQLRKVYAAQQAPSKELADSAYYNFVDYFGKSDGNGGMYFDNYNYFWDYAETMEVLLDKYERNGTEQDLETIKKFYTGFTNKFTDEWLWNSYNDDIMWMVIFCCRAYNLTGDEMFKTQAKTHFDGVYSRAYNSDLGGGLYWKNGNIMTKNSCINCPATIAACMLYNILEDNTYLGYAKTLFAWQLRTLYNAETGAVYDNIHYNDNTFSSKTVDETVYSYNLGTFIGAATKLYEITENEDYISYAKKAADYSQNNYYNNEVMNNENSGDDGPGFKGILARWLGYYIKSTGDDDYNQWLALNLKVGWNNRNNYGLVTTRWGTKTSDSVSERPFSYSTYVAMAQAYPYDAIVDPNPEPEPEPEPEPGEIAVTDETLYMLTNKTSGKVLNVVNSSVDDNSGINQWTYTDSASQQWQTKASDVDGYYALLVGSTGYALTVSGGYENGTSVTQSVYTGADSQLFKFTYDNDGYFTLTPKGGDTFALDVSSSSKDDGAKVQIYTSNLSGAQKWQLKKITAAEQAPSEAIADEAYESFIKAFGKADDNSGTFFNNFNGFWDLAESMEVLLDKYERNGTEQDLETIRGFYKGFVNKQGSDWNWNSYNDDIMWIIIFCCRAYNITGDEVFKTQAQTHFDSVYKRAYDDKLGGGLYWQNGNMKTKNSCINCPATIAACMLSDILDDRTYLDKAETLFSWEVETLFDKDTGAVNDNLHYDDDSLTSTTLDTRIFTYNQGTFIGAATKLYELTENENYIKYAKKAADYTQNVLFNGGVMSTENTGNDGPGFKGILARWFCYYIKSTGDSDYNEWLALNLKVGWNNRNNSGLVTTSWGTKASDNVNERPFSYSTFVALAQAFPYGMPIVPKPDPEPDPEPDPASMNTDALALLSSAEKAFFVNQGDSTILSEKRGESNWAYVWNYGAAIETYRAAYEANPDNETVKQRYIDILDGLEGYRQPYETFCYAASYGGGGTIYYDDNMWLVMGFYKAYELLGDQKYLDNAEKLAAFCYTGWDDVLGGGIYWNDKKESKNTCSNAPMALASCELYRITGKAEYLDWAKKIYGWTKSKLLNTDTNMYSDNIDLNGNVTSANYTYNTGCMLSSAVMLYQLTDDAAYLTDAKAIGDAAEPYYFKVKDGSTDTYIIAGASREPWFHAWLYEGYIRLSAVDSTYNTNVEHLTSAAENAYSTRDSATGLVWSDWGAGKNGSDIDTLRDQMGTARIMFDLYIRNSAKDAE